MTALERQVVGVAFGQLAEDAKELRDKMIPLWLEDDEECFVCGASLHGEARWYLALDTESPDGCASGYTCKNAECSRKGLVSLNKERKHW